VRSRCGCVISNSHRPTRMRLDSVELCRDGRCELAVKWGSRFIAAHLHVQYAFRFYPVMGPMATRCYASTLAAMCVRPNAPTAWYWLRPDLDDDGHQDWTSPSCKGCRVCWCWLQASAERVYGAADIGNGHHQAPAVRRQSQSSSCSFTSLRQTIA